MEATKNLNQIVQPAEKRDPERFLINLESLTDLNAPAIGVYKLEDCNNKALELQTPQGDILISYESKVQMITSADIMDQYKKVRYVSKLYNKYSMTTSHHQREQEYINNFSRSADISIYLDNSIAQKLFNAAATAPDSFQVMQEHILNNFILEFETMDQLQQFKSVLAAETPETQIKTWNFLKGSLQPELINAEDEQLKTVTRQRSQWIVNNIKFECLMAWSNKNHKIKYVKLQRIKPNYKSVLTE